jgi:signal transduction histidine kinase
MKTTSQNETAEFEAIAKALRTISMETSYEGLSQALLDTALGLCSAARGAVLLSEGGTLVARADANFPRERAKFFTSYPPEIDFRLPADLREKVLARQNTVVRQVDRGLSALFNPAKFSPGRDIAQLCQPLVLQERTIGVLHVESERVETFTPRCISLISMLASQAAVSFQSVQLFEALRETNSWMNKGQQIGRMGGYRWNTRTLLSRGSRECYRIFDFDLDLNPVPFQAYIDRVHTDDRTALRQALAEAVSTVSPFSHEYRVIHRNGTVLHVAAVGQFDVGPTGDLELDGIIADITERKAAEQALVDARNELSQAARLASLGELAGSIVHEINQPLTGIIASAEACLRWLARDPVKPAEARKSATRVIEQARRAHGVITGLRYLARGTKLRFTTVQVNDAIEEILLLLKRDLERGDITLTLELDKSIPPVEGDRVQLQQVILNLVRNAIDAMTVEAMPRVLTISSKVVDGHVIVGVSDTGIGIDIISMMRLFDAFYTTKSDGLGLGLSICRKIVAFHGGRLWVEESASNGATFRFSVPLRQQADKLKGS